MYIQINDENPSDYHIQQVVECLKQGGIIIYPTDAVYTMGCDIQNIKAHERLCALKGIKLKDSNFSIVCHDHSHLSDFTLPLDNPTFRLLKATLPGPFTYILNANKSVSKYYGHPKNTIGFRIPDHPIPRAIVQALGRPILSATIKNEHDIVEYIADPEEIYQLYNQKVDMVINGGWCGLEATTIVDCSQGTPVIVREGLGILP